MLRAIYERLRDSLFALPASIMVGMGLLALLARWLDVRVPDDPIWLLPTTVDSTRAILSTVATATITVAGIVFSMTAVVVQLATSQLSPRVTQSFLRDPYQQITVGISVGTFVYSLLVLSAVHGSEEVPFTSHDFSATLAVVLGVVSMVLIVFFIDRTMRNMRIDTAIRRLADKAEGSIARLPHREPVETETDIPETAAGSTIEVVKTGWVAAIDLDAVLAAVPPKTLVRIDLRIGDFITKSEVAARTWPEIDEERGRSIARAVTVTRTRSVATDPAYGLRQMVDIALRALSGSLNDATTASDVVRHLGGPLQRLLLHDLPGRIVGDEDGRRVYLPRSLGHADYVHDAFREIRLNATGQPYVLHALIETLASLIGVVEAAGYDGRTAPLRSEASETLAMVVDSDLPDSIKKHLLDFARRVGLDDLIPGEPAQ